MESGCGVRVSNCTIISCISAHVRGTETARIINGKYCMPLEVKTLTLPPPLKFQACEMARVNQHGRQMSLTITVSSALSSPHISIMLDCTLFSNADQRSSKTRWERCTCVCVYDDNEVYTDFRSSRKKRNKTEI